MKKIFRLFILFGIFCGFGCIAYYYRDVVIEFADRYFAPFREVTLGDVNDYYRNYDFDFVQNTNSFSPESYQDILNIYYTVLNAGKSTFTFYCPDEYEACIQDVQNLANDQDTLSDINNYVHPYNGFSHIETEYDSLGRVTITVVRSYSLEEIELINQKVDELYSQLVKEENSIYTNIRNIHDYIINNTRYDSVRSETGESQYHSDTAYGPLFEGYAICGGYTDLMELFLERMNIKSFKVSSEKHVWNAVYYNYHWLNLDLTWDDPVASDGNDYLEDSYFLIDTNRLLELETTEHYFKQEHYMELV